MAVCIMTYEVLTERRAGWHAGRRRPWRLRSEIACCCITALHHNWLHCHGCRCIMPPPRCHGTGTIERNGCESHSQTVNRGSALRPRNTRCTVFPKRQTSSHRMMICTSNKRHTSSVIQFNAPPQIYTIMRQNVFACTLKCTAWQTLETQLGFCFSTYTTLIDTWEKGLFLLLTT